MFTPLGTRSPASTSLRPATRSRRHLGAGALTALVVAALLGSLAGPAPAATTHRGSTTHGPVAAQTQATRPIDSVRVPPEFFGIHDASQQAYGRITFGSLRLWDSGVTWSDIETSPGVYDWTRLDSLVSDAQAHGVQVTLVLAMTPSFYSDAQSLPPTQLSHFSDYVRAVMNRYRDFNGQRGIVAYQVWNEGNIRTFWAGTPNQLAVLTRIVHRVRDQVDPGATVVAPPFAMRLASERAWFSRYQVQRVAGKPVSDFYDANAVSLYPMPTYGDRLGGPEDAMALLGGVRHRLAKAGVPAAKPLWATEINYGLQVGNPGILSTPAISERRQVANVIRTYLLGAADGLSRVFWYRYDWGRLPESEGGGTLGNTLLSDPSSPDQVSPAGEAMATASGWLHGRLTGTHGQAPCAQDEKGTYTCIVHYAGGVRRIYWNPQRGVRVPIPPNADYRQGSSGGRVSVGRGTTSLRVGFRPVMVNSPS